jgi:glycosyltransferase involved in cell wall biosynthesis
VKIATLGNAAVIHTRRWVECFRARGHEVRVWSLEPAAEGWDAHVLPRAPLPGFLRYGLATPALTQALARFQPDVVDAHFVPNYGVMAALSGFHPFSITAWGSDLLIDAPRDVLQRARARFVLTRADLVLADSNNLAAAARQHGADPARVHAIPWGVEIERFAALPAREPGLLFGARMHEPVYDIPTLIHGVRPVLARDPHARLVLAGDGSLRAEHERLAGELLPRDRVQFVGLLAPHELANWLGRAEVYLSSSWSDSTSVTLLEAMAAGAVPVVSDIDGNREWLADGDGARLFAPGDAAAMTRAIEQVLDDTAWAASARARNRAVIEARGVWNTNMGHIEALFEALARGARRGSRAREHLG